MTAFLLLFFIEVLQIACTLFLTDPMWNLLLKMPFCISSGKIKKKSNPISISIYKTQLEKTLFRNIFLLTSSMRDKKKNNLRSFEPLDTSFHHTLVTLSILWILHILSEGCQTVMILVNTDTSNPLVTFPPKGNLGQWIENWNMSMHFGRREAGTMCPLAGYSAVCPIRPFLEQSVWNSLVLIYIFFPDDMS